MSPPSLTVRAFTNDQYYLDKAFYSNHYKLKGHKGEDGPIVVDIGAHCGYFSFAALSLGAKKVYAFEPFPDNYRVLLQNTAYAELGKLIPYQLGVWTGNIVLAMSHPKLLEGIYYDYANLAVEEHIGPQHFIFCLPLSRVFSELVREKVDILKIGFSYEVEEVILACKTISESVRNIVFETSSTPEELSNFLKIMNERGFKESALSKIEDEEKFIVILSQDKIEDNFVIKMES
jgi:FkbM family methyltransferase